VSFFLSLKSLAVPKAPLEKERESSAKVSNLLTIYILCLTNFLKSILYIRRYFLWEEKEGNL
jgi:hypothetical protein